MKKLPSNMSHTFSEVPKAEIPRSTFDRSHGHKTTFDAGLLIPILVDEALPGDTFNCSMTGFARISTPIFPIMDNMYFDTHFFAVPMRLVWDNFQRFMGEQRDPGDSTDFLVPTMSAPAAGGYAIGSISDYMGIPTGVADLEHSCLWHRAYNLIWNEWFRDENLQDSVVVNRGDGPDLDTDYQLLRRGKRFDYFTSSLPWPQKGDSVTIPLGTTAPIIGAGQPTFSDVGAHVGGLTNLNDQHVVATGLTSQGYMTWADPALSADLSAATASTINQLRQAFQIQKLLERDARGGTRYTEIVRSHFQVTSPDARLQRPEFLGGGTSPVNITPVAQTSGSPADVASGYTPTPQGNLSAYGTSVMHGHGFVKSFTEHCLIIGLVSVRADLTYQQGLNRMFSRQSRYDFYFPALSHIGEQTVLQKEIFADGIPANDDKVFGYQERYAEYRYKPSIITGLFRSAAPQSLDAWHLSQDFANAPVLDDAFISENPPLDRVIAVPSEPHFIFDSLFKMHCARPMPVYGVPGLIDHF